MAANRIAYPRVGCGAWWDMSPDLSSLRSPPDKTGVISHGAAPPQTKRETVAARKETKIL
jgi:hypothetical protein